MVLVLTPCLYCNVSDSLDAAQQVAPGGDRRGRHVRRSGAGLDLHVPLVVHRAGAVAQPLPERDVHLLGQHGHLQRQSAAALRRLLHPRRPDGNSQPAAEGHHDPQPQDGRVVPGPGDAGRSVPAAVANQMFFALYTIAAAIYRWVVAFSICWFLYKLFESYELKVIGQIVVLASLYGLFCQPLYQLGKFFYVPGGWTSEKNAFLPQLGGLDRRSWRRSVSCRCRTACSRRWKFKPATPNRSTSWSAASLESIDVQARPDGEEGPATGAVAEPRFGAEDRRTSRQGQSLSAGRWKISASNRFSDRRATAEISSVEEALEIGARNNSINAKNDRDRLLLDGAHRRHRVAPAVHAQARRSRTRNLAPGRARRLDPENVGAHLEERDAVLPNRRSEKTASRDGHRPGRSEHGRSRPEGGS